MKKNIGIWIDTKYAYVIKLSETSHSIKKIESNIETRERIQGESKKYGRFGGQYLTYEKNRENKRQLETNNFIKNLLKELLNANSIVLFGPANMKKILEKEIESNMQIANKLKGTFNSEQLTENQMVAWVKDFFNHNNILV
jgi:hypothetical protein